MSTDPAAPIHREDSSEVTYLVYDVETTTRSPMGFTASPYWPGNQIVLAGGMLPNRTLIHAKPVLGTPVVVAPS